MQAAAVAALADTRQAVVNQAWELTVLATVEIMVPQVAVPVALEQLA
jgi:hypothetical protein